MKMRKILAVICAIAMICSFAVAASADEAKVTEIYTGNSGSAGWTQVFEIFTTNWGGTLDPAFITEGGYLSVYCTSTDFWQISVALSKESVWAQLDCHVDPEKWTGGTLTDNGDGSYVVTFTYDELAAAYGSDFSTLGAIYLYSNSGGDTIVSKVTWTEAAAEEKPEETVGYTASLSLVASDWSATTGFGADSSVKTTVPGDGTYTLTYNGACADLGILLVDIVGAQAALDAENKTYEVTELTLTIDGKDVPVDLSKVLTGDLEGNGNYRIELHNMYGASSSDPSLNTATAVTESLVLTFTIKTVEKSAAGETPDETTVPEETEPETTVPEETEPETTAPAAKPVKDKVTTIASSSTVSSGWQMATSTYTSYWGGTLDPNFIEKDGYITVKITATGELWSAHVVLQGEEKNNHKWQQIDKEVGKNFTANADGSYTVKFTYDELVAAYGTSDFSDLGCVYVYVNSADGSTVTVNSVTYTVPGSNANTGDETMIVMAVATMLLTACCMVYMVTSKKRAR